MEAGGRALFSQRLTESGLRYFAFLGKQLPSEFFKFAHVLFDFFVRKQCYGAPRVKLIANIGIDCVLIPTSVWDFLHARLPTFDPSVNFRLRTQSGLQDSVQKEITHSRIFFVASLAIPSLHLLAFLRKLFPRKFRHGRFVSDVTGDS